MAKTLKCCHAPADMGHMFGCPKNPLNSGEGTVANKTESTSINSYEDYLDLMVESCEDSFEDLEDQQHDSSNDKDWWHYTCPDN